MPYSYDKEKNIEKKNTFSDERYLEEQNNQIELSDDIDENPERPGVSDFESLPGEDLNIYLDISKEDLQALIDTDRHTLSQPFSGTEDDRANLKKRINENFIKKLPEFMEYRHKGYNITGLDQKGIKELEGMLQEVPQTQQSALKDLYSTARKLLNTLKQNPLPPENQDMIQQSNSVIRNLSDALEALNAAGKVSKVTWDQEVDRIAREQRERLVAETMRRLSETGDKHLLGSDNGFSQLSREQRRQRAEGLLFSEANRFTAEHFKFEQLKKSLLAENRITRQRLTGYLETTSAGILAGARDAREYAMNTLLAQADINPARLGNAEQLGHWTRNYNQYTRHIRVVDGEMNRNISQGNPLIGAFIKETNDEPAHIKIARAMLPVSDALGAVSVALGQLKTRVQPSEEEFNQPYHDGSGGLLKSIKKTGQKIKETSAHVAWMTGNKASKTASRMRYKLKESSYSESVNGAVKGTALLLLDEIQQAERRIKLLPSLSWMLQEAVEQHSSVTQRIAYRDELPELSELLNQQLEQEAARWQAIGQQSRDKLQELIAPITRLAQEKWAQDLYFQLGEELRKERQDRRRDRQHFDEILAEAVGQFAEVARELDSAAVRLAEHGHSGSKELQEKVAKWLRDLSELKGKVKAGVVEITGTSLDNFSRGGMLARGMSEWAEDLKQSYLQEKRPEDRTVAAELFERTLMEIVEENRTHFAKESDPEAEGFLKRLTLALNHAAENTLVYPPTPEEILASSRSIPDDIRLWAEQKIVSGAISAALRGGFKLLVNTTSLPLRVAARAGRTTYRVTRGVQAIRRGVKLGQSRATKIENKYINQEISKATIRFALSISPSVGYGIAAAITGKRIYDGDLNKVTKKILVDMVIELPWVAVDASINFAARKYTEHSIKQAIQNALDKQADRLASRINKEIEDKSSDVNVEIVPQETSVSPAETVQSTPEPISDFTNNSQLTIPELLDIQDNNAAQQPKIRRKRDASAQMLTDNDEHSEENKKYFSTIKKDFNRNENDDIEPFDETDKKELSGFVLNAALNRSPHSDTGSSSNILTEQNIKNFPEIIRERYHYLKKIEPNITDDDTRKAIFLNLKRFIHRNINKLSFNNISVLLNSLYSISDENNDFDDAASKIKAKYYDFKKHFYINRNSYVKIKKAIYDEEKENKPSTIKLPSDEIISTEEFSSEGINDSMIKSKNKLKEISNKSIENFLLVKEGDELLKFSSLEIKSLIKYLHLINNENIITKIKNHVVKNNYEDIIFASNLAQEITEDSKLFLGPASEEELTAVIYQLAIGKKFDNLSLTRIYNKFLFSKERDNPFTKVISKNKPKGYFTISDFKKSGDAEDRSKFNQQFYDYRDKYNQYDASILAGSIITSSNITVEEFTQAPKSIQTFAVFGKSLGEYRSTKNVTEKPPQYIPGRIVLMKLSSGRYLLSSNLLGNIKSIILEEQEGNFININLSNKGLVNSKKIAEVDPRYQLYEGLYHVYPDNMVYYEIIKPLYGSDWSKNPISKISHDYFTVAQDSKAAKIEINASSTVANTLAQGMAVALAAYIEDLHQSMDETSKTWKIIRGFIPFYNTIYNASTDSEYIIDSGEILLDIVSIIPIFKTASTVGKSASEVINLGRSALKAGVANGLRGLQLFKYVAKQVAPELLSASYKNSLLITKAFYDAIEPVPIRSSLKGLYKGIKNDLNLTSLEGISSKVLMTSNEKANLKLSNNGIWKNDAGKSYIKDAKGEFYQVERNQSNQGWVLINGDRKTPISNSGGRWGVKKEEGEFKRLLNGDHRTFPQSWSVKNSDLNYITPEKGIYKLGSENSQKLSEPKYYIKQEGAFYQVRWDESNHTWRIINPANPGQFSYSLPVKLAKKNSWEFNSDIGLKGGTRTDLNNWMKEHIDEYSRLPKKNEEAIARYTGGRYRLYNEKLRAGKMTKNIRESIDEVVSSLRMLPEYSGTVYRGGAIKKDVYKEMKVGGVIFDPAFLSTSADSAAAMEFLRKANTGKDEMRYLMTLEVKRGRSLMDKSLSQFADTEAEVLLLPETPIEITKIENKGPDLYIYGKEVDPVGQDAKDIFNNKMKIMSEPSTGSLGAKVDNVPVVKKNTDIDIDVNNHADSNKDGLWEIHSDVGLKGGGLNDLRDIFRKNSASLESKLSAGDTSVFRTRGYLGTEKNTKIDTSFEYLRVDKVSNHKSGRIFSMDSIGEGGEMEGVISVSKGSNLSSKLSGNTIGKWGVKDKLDDSVDFIEVSNGASGAVGIKISLNQLQEGKPVIVSAGELSGCTMIYAVDDDYFYAYHAGQNPGDNSWLTSRDGVNSIYQTHMSLKGKPISDLSLDNNNDLIKIFSTYDKATINYFGKKKPISLSGKNTSLSVDTHISTPYSENVNVFDYNAAKGSDPRLGLAYAILTRKNGKVSVSTYSEDISIALKDKKLTSLARKEENLVTNKNIVTAGNSKEQVSNVMSRHAEKITYNLAPDIPASEYLDELYQKTGIAAKIQDPKGKCQVLMNPIADFMKEKGFFDIRYRGMYIWNNATEQIPMNHFVVVGKKGGKDYVFDVSAHQFENKGMSDLNEPLILSAEDWAKKYRGATTRKLIYYSDFKNARTAANTYHALPRALVPGSMEGKTFITSPNWYDTFKRTEYDKLFIKRARLLRDRNHNPLELEQVNRRLTALLNETSDVSHHVNY